MKHKVFLNLNKGLTFLVMLAFMEKYHQWQNPTAWVYLALHGIYGILWVLKSLLYPDKTWERKVPFWFGLVSWISLTLYWIPGWLLMLRNIQAPAWVLGICISLYTLGIFFHFTSDMQKNVMLELRPNELITDRMMSLSRNINYFGEFLIYLSFAILPLTWLALIPLTFFVLFYWSYMIRKKEISLSQKPGYQLYKQKTKKIIPFIF
jgi:protein-S-isoprenylcysteine O-methyltransferase Ste14